MNSAGACVVLGGGGHARVLLEGLRAAPEHPLLVMLDNDPGLWGQSFEDVQVLGGDQLLPQMAERGVSHFLVGVGGVGRPGDNARRQTLFEKALACGLLPLTVTHPSALCSPQAVLGPGCQLFPGCVVNAGAMLRQNVIVNTGAIVEHDCQLGDHCHVATGACLGGGVRLGQRAHVGLGAAVRQYLSLGDGVIVGAGAVVVADVPAGQTVVGVPARPLKGPGPALAAKAGGTL